MPEYNPKFIRAAAEKVAKARRRVQGALEDLPGHPNGFGADVPHIESAIEYLNEAYAKLRQADDALGRALSVD